MIDAVDHFPHTSRTIAFSAAGDRRDIDIVRQGELIGDAFDHVILFEDCNRGRPEGEVLALLRRGVERGLRVVKITESQGERETIGLALRSLQPGELLVAQPDDIEEILPFVQTFLAEHPVTRPLRPVAAATAKAASSAGLFATQALDPGHTGQ